MSAQLRQMNIRYSDREDRLLLRVSNSDGQEYRIWCTRRYTRLLLERFDHEFEAQIVTAKPVPAEAMSEIKQMQHEQKVDQGGFQKKFAEEATSYPLGEDGLLATTLKYGKTEKGEIHLQISDGKSPGLTLRLNQALQHQFYELLRRATDKAEWFGSPVPSQVEQAKEIVH